MAYGAPSSESDVEQYLTNIRQGRTPATSDVEDLKRRYRLIGGRSPLGDITKTQAKALESLLASEGLSVRVYVGMKHWYPYIREVVPEILNDGCDKIIGLILAPHYSPVTSADYKQILETAIKLTSSKVELEFVESWFDNSLFHRAVADSINRTLTELDISQKVHIVYTAHSIPDRTRNQSDSYSAQLRCSCQNVSEILNVSEWLFAYQSAGRTGEGWLGPSLQETLRNLSEQSPGACAVIVPIGFVADNLEILYDIDVEAQALAKDLGLRIKRVQSLNSDPIFIEALADIVLKRIGIICQSDEQSKRAVQNDVLSVE
jgi:ferrochelatase